MNVRTLLLNRSEATRDALAVQTEPVDESLGADWLWVLDGSAVPCPDALERFVAVLAEWTGPPPILLASKVVLADGTLDRASAPWPRLTDKAVAIEACEHRLVSIRAARHGSLLVRAGRWEAGADADADDLAWTGGILRRATGLLVPGSVAVRDAPASSAPLFGQAQMLRGDALDLEEKLWFGYALGHDVLRRRDARLARRLVRGLAGR